MELEPGKLFIHGISSETKGDHLKEYFETFGEVVKAVINKNGHRRYGFITFEDPAVAERVVKERHTINDRTVKAKNYVPMIYQRVMSKKNDSIQGLPGHPTSAKTIFVGGLASAVTKNEFKKYFGQFGTITDVVVNYDLNTQRSMSSGFITYDSEEAVDKVLLKAFYVLNGKVVHVKRAFEEELSAGPSRSHLGGCNNGRNGVSSSLNANTEECNPTSVGGDRLRMNDQFSPVTVCRRSGYPSFGSSSRGSTIDKDNNGSTSNVIKIKPITKKVQSKDSSNVEEPDESPLRSILCLKKEDMKRFEETEDCFILGFDPYESLDTLGQCSQVTVHRNGYPSFGSSNRGSTVDKDNKGSTSNVIKIKPITKKVRRKHSSKVEEPDGSPLRSILCLKKEDMKRFEETEDCFILGFDPYESHDTLGQCSQVTVCRSGYPSFGSSNRGCTVDKDNNGSTTNVIKIKPITKKVQSRDSSKVKEPDGSPLRSILCLKNKEDMKLFEETEDCFILGFDPYESLDISKLSISDSLDSTNGPELSVVAEKGQVACRDYPHSRHLCIKNPFAKTPHESFCKLCYCYICDLAAPCKYWTGEEGHCHALDDEAGKSKRRTMRALSTL